jgi:hypothetical protein
LKEIAEVNGRHIHLTPGAGPTVQEAQNGYHIIPTEVVERYAEQLKRVK